MLRRRGRRRFSFRCEPTTVSVVVVNYKGADDTNACLDGLRSLDWPAEALEVVVVENNSGDGSAERIRAAHPEARLLELGENTGFAGGCNRGAAAATGDYVAFLNNDARPDAQWLSAAVDELQAIADEHGLKLMFDAAHAFGSTYKGQTIGRFGACEVLSFHATKSFNTFEGGAVVTNDDELAETMRLMRNFGFHGYDNVIHPGTNGKMIEVCAAMGLTNLDGHDEIIEANIRNHAAYTTALSDIPGISMVAYDSAERNSHHYVVIEVDKSCAATRDQIVVALQAENILARKYFWPGAHRMKPYRDLFPHAGLVLQETNSVAEKVVVLPTGNAISIENIHVISNVITHAALG